MSIGNLWVLWLLGSSRIFKKLPFDLGEGGEAVEIMILFTELKGFITLSEIVGAEDTACVLNIGFSGMRTIVLEFGGTIDDFVGGGFGYLSGDGLPF